MSKKEQIIADMRDDNLLALYRIIMLNLHIRCHAKRSFKKKEFDNIG